MVISDNAIKNQDINLVELLNLPDPSDESDGLFSVSIGTGDINGTTLASDLLEGRVHSLKDFAAQTKREIQRCLREHKGYERVPTDDIQFSQLTAQNSLKELALFQIMHSHDIDLDDMESKRNTFVSRFLGHRETPPMLT